VNFSIDQDVDVSPEVALRAYGSPAFYEGRPSVENISVIEVVSHQSDDTRSVIEVRFKFTGSISSAVKAVIDPNKMSWVTRTEVFLEERRSSFKVLPDHYPDRLTSTGGYRFADGKAPGTATITVEGDLKVHFPLVGRTVERVILSGLRSYIAKEVASLPEFSTDE
jgi:Protein of unknown function (DUF2505)